MKISRFVLLGALLAAGVGVAVSTVVAQSRPEAETRQRAERYERSRPRVMMLDGRGAQLGVMVADLDAQALKSAGVTSGVRIDEVYEDSPASEAGLREGDIVVELDGERVRSARQFARLIQETPEGGQVTLGVMRDGSRQSIQVTPESRGWGWGVDGVALGREIERGLRDIEPRLRELEPRLREFRFNAPFDFNFEWPRLSSPRVRLGVQLQELSPQLADYFGAADGGVLVSSVSDDSPAQRAGLRAGDVITTIDGDRVRDTGDLIDELRDKEGQVTIGILRDKKETTVTATLEELRPRRVIRRPA